MLLRKEILMLTQKKKTTCKLDHELREKEKNERKRRRITSW